MSTKRMYVRPDQPQDEREKQLDAEVRDELRSISFPSRYAPLSHSKSQPSTPVVTIATDYEEVVVAVVEWQFGSVAHQASGSAKRHPKDDFDYEVGVHLALWRAFESAADLARDHARARGKALGIGEVDPEFNRRLNEMSKLFSDLGRNWSVETHVEEQSNE